MTDMAEVLESGLAEARERERIAARAVQADALELRNAAMDAGLPVHEHLVELWLNAYDGRPTPDDGPQVDRAAAAQRAPAPTLPAAGDQPASPRDRRPAGRRGQPAAPWWPSSPRPQQGARIGAACYDTDRMPAPPAFTDELREGVELRSTRGNNEPVPKTAQEYGHAATGARHGQATRPPRPAGRG